MTLNNFWLDLYLWCRGSYIETCHDRIRVMVFAQVVLNQTTVWSRPQWTHHDRPLYGGQSLKCDIYSLFILQKLLLRARLSFKDHILLARHVIVHGCFSIVHQLNRCRLSSPKLILLCCVIYLLLYVLKFVRDLRFVGGSPPPIIII